MLKTIDLIEGAKEELVPMLKEVNIPDFTKCIATITLQKIDRVNESMIKKYLLQWAESKYKFYKMLGNKIKADYPIVYLKSTDEISADLISLGKEFPAYYPWLFNCRRVLSNTMTASSIGWEQECWIRETFPSFKWEGCSLTKFFQSYLSAPKELVDKIGRLYENNEIAATYTISIDPVDMMLASETPYGWTSCYSINNAEDYDKHFDGCIAAVLDTSSLIAYVWDKEGKFDLNDFHFKSIRYKKMRHWFSIAPDFNAFYMNEVYPGKCDYDQKFKKVLRNVIERVICDYTKEENKWKQQIDDDNIWCQRKYPYGYEEYDNDKNIFFRGEIEGRLRWFVYDVPVLCPCGCGYQMPGFYSGEAAEDTSREYNGNGFTCKGVKEEEYWCSYAEEYCSCDPDNEDGCCDGCLAWMQAHPVCSIDRAMDCRYPDDVCEINEGVAHACKEDCKHCPMWQKNL